MRKLSIGLDSTLENWIMLSTITFGKDSKATEFLRRKAEESSKGIKEEIIVDEGQLLMVLSNLHFDNKKTVEVQDIKVPENRNLYFKINLPDSLESFKTGNGEGVWACGDDNTFNAWKNNVKDGIYFVKILNDSVYYPLLKCYTIIPVEMRGEKRPVAIFDELKEKYGESSKEAAIEKFQYYNLVTFVIESMIDLWLDKTVNEGYSFLSDLDYYYNNTIAKEKFFSKEEFDSIVANVLKSKGIKKESLT